MPKVNPKIIIWARESLGLTIAEAAKKIGLSDPSRLQEIEAGEREPTRRQLVNMSEKYKRPLLTFYLAEKPAKSEVGQDFRTLTTSEPQTSEVYLQALLRDIYARQGLVKSALEDTEEDEILSFVGSANIKEGHVAVAEIIRKTLDFEVEDYRRQRTAIEAFGFLRKAVEDKGIFVLLAGNLGNHYTSIDVNLFRGFALADPVAPFIVINENDSRAAWSFTLLHELTHIFLGETGISGYNSEAAVEKFCDSVAAAFLLNPDEFTNFSNGAKTLETWAEQISFFANERNLSRKMVAYNLLRSGIITPTTYQHLNNVFDTERLAEKKAGKAKGTSAPSYYVVKKHRIGNGLVNIVGRMVSEGALSTTKAGKVLGVKPTSVARLISNDSARRGII